MTAQRVSEFTSARARTRFLATYADTLQRLWPTDRDSVDVPTAFGTTRVYRSGRAAGDPFVLLPGGGGNSVMWHRYVARLGRTRPVIAIDPVGEPGLFPQEKPFHDGRDVARWLGDVLTALQVDRAHLVGCSYGGWVALQHELHSPGRAATITLLDPGGFGRITARMWRWVILGGLAGFAPASVRRRAARWLHNATLLDDDIMRLAIATATFRRRMPPTDPFTDDELRAITAPTLLLLGELSAMYDAPQVAARARELMPAGQAEVVPGASHDLPMYCPDLVIERLIGFADAAPARP